MLIPCKVYIFENSRASICWSDHSYISLYMCNEPNLCWFYASFQAHTLYNSCAVRDGTPDKQRWLQARYDIQKIYWGADINATRDQVDEVSHEIKQKLETLRTELREKLIPVTNEVETWPCSFESLESSPDKPEFRISCVTLSEG